MSDNLIKASDMVDVVDAAGNAIEGMPKVPKSWLGTSLVPAGTKKGKAKVADPDAVDATAASTPAPSTRKTGEEPPRGGPGSGLAEWQAFAREKSGSEDAHLDETGEELSQKDLIAKFGAEPSSS